MNGLMAEAGCVGPQFSGALQGDGLGIESPRQGHQLVELGELFQVIGQWGQFFLGRLAFRVKELNILDFKGRNGLQGGTSVR